MTLKVLISKLMDGLFTTGVGRDVFSSVRQGLLSILWQ